MALIGAGHVSEDLEFTNNAYEAICLNGQPCIESLLTEMKASGMFQAVPGLAREELDRRIYRGCPALQGTNFKPARSLKPIC